MKLLKPLLVLMMLASPAMAQNGDMEAPAAKPRFSGSIADFKTVRFMCKIEGRGLRDAVMSNACVVADTATKDGSYEADIDFQSVAREDDDAFTLLVTATSSGKVPRSVNVRVEASKNYVGAIDTKADERSPAAAPRAGRLVFWDRNINVVSSGHLDEVDNAVRSSIRAVIADFFRYYISQK